MFFSVHYREEVWKSSVKINRATILSLISIHFKTCFCSLLDQTLHAFYMLYWLTRFERSLKFSLSFYELLLLDHALFRNFSSDKDSTNYLHNSFVLQKPSASWENSIKPSVCAQLKHRTSVHVIDCCSLFAGYSR